MIFLEPIFLPFRRYLVMNRIFTIAACLFATAAQAQTGLRAASATSQEVRLTWTAASPAPATYVVERKDLDGAFAALPLDPPTSTPAASDRSIDAFATYVYRVRARQADGSLGAPSNEITVGPPPTGVSAIRRITEASAAALESPSDFARRPKLVLDENGDPAVAYLLLAPGGDAAQTRLEFSTWNRAAYRWNPPSLVAVTGAINATGPEGKSFSLARDRVRNQWGVAYPAADGSRVMLATSSDGVTWNSTKAADCGEIGCQRPVLALHDGQAWLAYVETRDAGIRLRTGSTGAPADWKQDTVPLPAGGTEVRSSLDIALDSNGQPAIAFWSNTSTYNVVLALWRPNQAPAIVLDTKEYQSDTTDVDLEFAGARAHILVDARRSEEYFTRYDQNLWYTREEAAGFTAPLNLPSDGETSLAYLSLAVTPEGNAAAAATEAGGSGQGIRCGQMKLLRRDSGGSWSACSPVARDKEPFRDVVEPQLVFAANRKLYLVFGSPGESTLDGLLLWREP